MPTMINVTAGRAGRDAGLGGLRPVPARAGADDGAGSDDDGRDHGRCAGPDAQAQARPPHPPGPGGWWRMS